MFSSIFSTGKQTLFQSLREFFARLPSSQNSDLTLAPGYLLCRAATTDVIKPRHWQGICSAHTLNMKHLQNSEFTKSSSILFLFWSSHWAWKVGLTHLILCGRRLTERVSQGAGRWQNQNLAPLLPFPTPHPPTWEIYCNLFCDLILLLWLIVLPLSQGHTGRLLCPLSWHQC